MIIHSRDTVGAHQNLNARDLTTFLSEMVCHPWTSIFNLPIKFEDAIATHYEDMKGTTKCRNGMLWGSEGHSRSVTGNSTKQ